jgi:hypothetical protein
MTPGADDVRAYRWTPFKELFPIEGINLTGATLAMQVRLYRDAPGDPLISLTASASPAQGLSLSVVTVDGVPTTTIEARIDEATIEALLPFPDSGVEQGANVELVYDIHITTAALGKRRWIEGAFIIVPGATH